MRKNNLRSGLRMFSMSLISVLLIYTNASAQQGISGTITGLSGGRRIKIVWQLDTTAEGNHVFGGSNLFKLMGYDTDDDTIREIKSVMDDYTKPLLTHDGSRVVYSDRVERKVFVCNWDGSGVRQVTSGFAGAVWFDENSDIEWVYFQDGGDGDNNSVPIKRVNLDDIGQVELVWSSSDTNAYWMSISADGARIASSWPWPKCGAGQPSYDGSGGGELYFSDNGYYTTGCWTTITPDTTYRVGVFDGAHRAWQVWDWPVGQMRLLDLHSAPGIDGWEIYHPKMSNNPRFVAITGPYSQGQMGSNNIMAGGPQIEVYLGKVDAGFSRVTDWVKVTGNSLADIFPDVWVDPGVSNQVRIDSFNVTPDSIALGNTATLSWQTTNSTSVSIDQGIGSVGTSGSWGVSPSSDTTYTLTAEGAGGPVTRQVSLAVVSLSLPLAINCGDQSPAASGWIDEDAFRTGGEEFDFSGSVDLNNQTNAAPADVYLTCVHRDHSYSFPLPDGSYTVRLHFYDGYTGVERAMDYTIEGVKVLDDFNITTEAGGSSRALVKEFSVQVSDGDGLQIIADKDQGDDAFEAGIEIVQGADQDRENPTIIIESPVQGASLSGDVVVQGTAEDNVGVSRVEISLDGGEWMQAQGSTTWSYTIYELALSDGSHELSARATDTSGNQAVDTVQFSTNNQPSITIVSPSGGESWQARTVEHIRWNTENLYDVTIRFSADGGATYREIVPSMASDDPQWGDYSWDVPNEGTDQARILIHGYFDSSVLAESNKFTIVPEGEPFIDLQSPRAGDRLTGGELHSVTWNATDVDTVVLEYSLDIGASYDFISSVNVGDQAWGDVSWTVPNVQCDVAQLRARSPSGDVQDVSGLFSIEPANMNPGELEVDSVTISGRVPDGAGSISQIQVAEKTFPVASNGTFQVKLDIKPGVEKVLVRMLSDDGSKSRLMQLDIKDAGPPIDGLVVSAKELREFFGGRSGVLVWVDAGGGIRVLDFRVDEPTVRVLPGSQDSVNPIISPDGTRIVYSQGRPNGPKNIFVSTLDGSKSNMVAMGDVGYFDFSGGKESIVYCDWSDKKQNGSDGGTYRLELTPGGVEPIGQAVQVCERAMDAGPNMDLGWLGQVYENLWAYDVVNQVEYPTEKFFLQDGQVADHQTCNGSMAPDDTGRLMCLVIPHDFVRIFSYTAASDDFRQTSEFRLPPGMTEWEFPEWSTDPGYFTAILRAGDLLNRLFVARVEQGELVPDVLQITGEQTGVSFSHLYLEP